ncbi:MAG: adenylosuccinate lyase [Anaerolineae bacterium]
MYGYNTFLSPFTWRYGSDAMRYLWSEDHKRHLWRRIWVALASAQHVAGLVTKEQLAELQAKQDQLDVQRSAEIEAQIHHDLMAEIRCFAEQCPSAGKIIHLGATSADIEDNADALRLREGLRLILAALKLLLSALCDLITRTAKTPCMGYTHLQPAEPTTIGYRLAVYAQDLAIDYDALRELHQSVRGKGFKGAVGTAASYAQLLSDTDISPRQMEQLAMMLLNLEAYPIATQTYSRHQDWRVLSALSGVGLTLHKMLFDVRLLQSPLFGEWSEPFGATQVGSSAMPFKRNPIHSENVDSLARLLSALPQIAWHNAANSLLERTLDDSANRREVLPVAFLALDEMLARAARIIKGLVIDEVGVQRNVATYGVFAATERVLMEAVKAGGDRQALHEVIREHSLRAWAEMRHSNTHTLIETLKGDARLTQWLSPQRIHDLLYADEYVGDAPERALELAKTIRSTLENT